IVDANGLREGDIVSAIFTTTADLNAEFPALAARRLGWVHVPLLCSHEMDVPGSLPLCLRVLVHVNTEKQPHEMAHVYLRDARVLRPDIRVSNPETGGGQPK
ncbi:MAG TPA: chorismate mutase, partial [Dehalococcoidia bacterium]|nr:chorismate mutase [Dehalococcoidia bacterium]